MTYPNLRNEGPTLLKMITKDDEIKEVKNKTEKHDPEKPLKPLKIDSELYVKKYNSVNKKKYF